MNNEAGLRLFKANCRLAVYGTLGPGRPNHHHLANLGGAWLKGFIRGDLVGCGWGAVMGFPGLVLNDLGPAVAVDVLESPDLPTAWSRLDDFEGEGYELVMTTVSIEGKLVDVHIYILATQPTRKEKAKALQT